MTPTRRRFLELLGGVGLLHVIAITLYYSLEVQRWPSTTQRVFAWVWMGVTVVIIMVGLQRIKRARRSRIGSTQV